MRIINCYENAAKLTPDQNNNAKFNEGRRHRFALWRIWDRTKSLASFVMLNPSKADEEENDPTIKRVKAICEKNGFGGFIATNLFSLVSTNPDLLQPSNSNLKESDEYLALAADKCDRIICAWGNKGQESEFENRHIDVLKILGKCGKPIVCLEITKGNAPKHPLYVKVNCNLQPFIF